MSKLLVSIGLILMMFSLPAEARHHKRYHHVRHYADYGNRVAHPVGCPSTLFCGCGVSVKVFGRPVANLFLASNWFKYPRAHAGAGMVAVRNHHVMYIMQANGGGSALVYDPNSGGGATRVHTVSLVGYTIVNPHGGLS